MVDAKQVPIVIPAFNPDNRLIGYVSNLLGAVEERIIIVDDGSLGNAKSVFEKCKNLSNRVIVLSHAVNKGKGAALKTAFKYILSNLAGLVGCVTADSDGQHAVLDVERCRSELIKNPSSLVLGCRCFSGGNVPWKSSFGNNFMRFCFLLATGRKFVDTQTGLRAIPLNLMREFLSIKHDRFEFESEMLLRLDRVQIMQLSIDTIYENGNKGTHFRPIIDSVKILSVLLRSIISRFIRFTISSLSSCALDIALFYLFYNVAFDALQHCRLLLSVALSRAISLVYNYLINKVMVFHLKVGQSGWENEVRMFSSYLLLALIIMGASYGLTKLGASYYCTIPIIWIKVIVDTVLFLLGFGIQRIFIFHNRNAMPFMHCKSN